ncbi:MAG TPA: hypothetical protein VIN73_05955 [Vicingaceae bacterium]
MKTVIRVCDETGNKHSGFKLCNNENIVKLFPHGVYKDFEFQIGKFDYKVVDVYIDGFYNGLGGQGPSLDDSNYKLGTFIWISCETNDKRIIEGRSEEDLISIANDLGIKPLYPY